MPERRSDLKRYAVVVLSALALGAIFSRLPSKHPFGGSGLSMSQALSYIAYGSALIFFWLLSHRAAGQLPADGEGWAFARAILHPLATLVVVFGAYLLVSSDPSAPGRLSRLAYAAVIAAAGWLTLAWVSNIRTLMNGVEARSLGNGRDATVRLVRSSAPAGSVRETATSSEADLARMQRMGHSSLGRYELLKELGRGSMGVVYLGNDPTINRLVAIKTMRLDQIDGADELKEFKERFFREAESTGRLSHPNIVTIYDAGEERQLGYIAMELLEGMALSAWCRKDNLLPLARVMAVAATVADALDYAHGQGVVHRDIKPANIMIGRNGTVKVMDFGIARMATASATKTKVILGTPNYMSPEQLKGTMVDGRSDVFSVGVVLFELMTGEKPFEAETISSLLFKIAHEPHRSARSLRPDLSRRCEAILDRALDKDCANRYGTAGELAQDLRACLGTLSA